MTARMKDGRRGCSKAQKRDFGRKTPTGKGKNQIFFEKEPSSKITSVNFGKILSW